MSKAKSKAMSKAMTRRSKVTRGAMNRRTRMIND
jgi:hypothetical protein